MSVPRTLPTRVSLPDLSRLDDDQLLQVWGGVMKELRSRNVTRSHNTPSNQKVHVKGL